jgi:hypothetical protein
VGRRNLIAPTVANACIMSNAPETNDFSRKIPVKTWVIHRVKKITNGFFWWNAGKWHTFNLDD